MDKLSEHAIRMLEIADKPYRTENVINANLQDRHDMAQAIYDLILQVQMLKMADRKTEPKQGKWIFQECTDEIYGRAYECSICGVAVVGNHHHFCPNCGAKMKGAGDGRKMETL